MAKKQQAPAKKAAPKQQLMQKTVKKMDKAPIKKSYVESNADVFPLGHKGATKPLSSKAESKSNYTKLENLQFSLDEKKMSKSKYASANNVINKQKAGLIAAYKKMDSIENNMEKRRALAKENMVRPNKKK